MAKLIYAAIASLDGYVADRAGTFGWAAPDEEVHRFVNDLTRPVGTYLYGRRMYEVMVAWETMPDLAAEPEVIRDFAGIWRAADKVVYSTTLAGVTSDRTRVERSFDPAAVAALKAASHRDLTVGGPTLAAAALAAGLVDECQLVLVPAVVGGGTRFFPDGLRLDLGLLEQRRFANGTTYLHYRVGARLEAGQRRPSSSLGPAGGDPATDDQSN